MEEKRNTLFCLQHCRKSWTVRDEEERNSRIADHINYQLWTDLTTKNFGKIKAYKEMKDSQSYHNKVITLGK